MTIFTEFGFVLNESGPGKCWGKPGSNSCLTYYLTYCRCKNKSKRSFALYSDNEYVFKGISLTIQELESKRRYYYYYLS